MKVGELIEHLKTMPQDAMVVVDGYEDGVTELKICGETTVKLNKNNRWYYGEHEECHPSEEDAVTVCYLPR